MSGGIRASWALVASLGFIGSLEADVLRVGPGQAFTELEAAVAAAADGDLILVEPGLYTGLDIGDKSISVIGTEPGRVRVLTASGTKVSSLSVGKCVVLANLVIEMPAGINPTPSALLVTGCAGSVRVENCSIYGSVNCWFPDPAVTVSASTDVVFTRCTLEGGYGQDNVSTDGSEGGAGLRVTGASRVALFDCLTIGGDGGEPGGTCWCIGGDGGHGVQVGSGSFVTVSGSVLTGGTEGLQGDYWSGIPGNGIYASSGSTVVTLDSQSSSIQGSVQQLPGRSHLLSAVNLAPPRSEHRFSIRADPGDIIYLLDSDRAAFTPRIADMNGVQAVDAPYLAARPIGVMVGTIQVFHLPIAELAPGRSNTRRFVQVVVQEPGGLRTLSGPVSLDVFE